jgi:hypothetical protein
MVNIIMCTYNGEKYISEQLESIADNTVSDWMLYIFDDCSNDNTINKAKYFLKKYPGKVHITVNAKQCGVVNNFLENAYKIGMEMSKDDFIMFCDQDDVWNNDKIEITLNEMKKNITNNGNDKPILVCSDVEVVDDYLNIISSSFLKMNHYNIKKMDFPHLMMENKVQGCTVMFNKSMAEKLNVLPKHACMHDAWLGFIASTMGNISYIDEPTMKYRQHSQNVAGSIDFWADIKGKFLNLSGQRRIVFDTCEQIKEFIEIYGRELSKETLMQAEAFATLESQGFWEKRMNIVRYNMWKSGILRNIGLMVLL